MSIEKIRTNGIYLNWKDLFSRLGQRLDFFCFDFFWTVVNQSFETDFPPSPHPPNYNFNSFNRLLNRFYHFGRNLLDLSLSRDISLTCSSCFYLIVVLIFHLIFFILYILFLYFYIIS